MTANLSMRRLGAALERDPMILYRHAPGKPALLDGVVETGLAQLSVDPADPDWTAQLRAVARDHRLAGELTAQGHPVSDRKVADLLRGQGFSLQANARTVEGKRHPDRDAQFRYINGQARAYQDAGDPVISVDAKKKETVGGFGNAGRQWRPGGDPARVRDHDFASEAKGKAIPYGICDLAANAGWVNVGTDQNTAAFAVESIRRWWNGTGRADYPAARRCFPRGPAPVRARLH